MSYRLNPYKILRLFLIIAFLSYAFIEVRDYVKRKEKKTESVVKTLEIRKDDFVNSDEVKKKLIESSGTIENVEKVPTNENIKKEEIETQKVEKENVEEIKEIDKNLNIDLNEKVKLETNKKEEKVKTEITSKKSEKKYIQVATFQTEAMAKKTITQLGGNFSIQLVKGTSGKTMYTIISSSTDNPKKLNDLETQVKKKFGGGYLIRTAGK